MELKQLTKRIFYCPHEEETDRPMLAYIRGDRLSLAIDAGNSTAHVDEFYGSLEGANLKKPDLTVITHWHWDHTFGMCQINGLSMAHEQTNKMLAAERRRFSDPAYMDSLKEENAYFANEYKTAANPQVALGDIQFETDLHLNLGQVSAHIFHAQSPHTEDTTLIYVPEERTLFLGDSTCGDFYNDGFMDQEKLQVLMQTIENTDCQYCILSHCEPLTKTELLDYLQSESEVKMKEVKE